ncbi:MAG: hypothetical protein ABI548_02835 [Polyangiaceae bacterium]
MSTTYPFEESDGVQTVTYGCPCGSMHALDEFQQTGERFRDAETEYTVSTCPEGRRVYLAYDQLQLPSDDVAYAAVRVDDVPAGAVTFPR